MAPRTRRSPGADSPGIAEDQATTAITLAAEDTPEVNPSDVTADPWACRRLAGPQGICCRTITGLIDALEVM